MRHGVARHNVPPRDTEKPPDHRDPVFWDPALVSYHGHVGAIHAGHDIRQWLLNGQNSLQLIVTSPLTRCIQTAVLAFLPGDEYYPHAPPPLHCKQEVREAFGMLYPDKRRPKSQLQRQWPQVYFEDSMTENDDAWSTDHRESWSDIQTRVDAFLQWLVQRPESVVAVVTHGVWMETLFRSHAPAVLQNGTRVHNCDVYACLVRSENGSFIKIDRTQHISGMRR